MVGCKYEWFVKYMVNYGGIETINVAIDFRLDYGFYFSFEIFWEHRYKHQSVYKAIISS